LGGRGVPGAICRRISLDGAYRQRQKNSDFSENLRNTGGYAEALNAQFGHPTLQGRGLELKDRGGTDLGRSS
jgi:hypothetical protein